MRIPFGNKLWIALGGGVFAAAAYKRSVAKRPENVVHRLEGEWKKRYPNSEVSARAVRPSGGDPGRVIVTTKLGAPLRYPDTDRVMMDVERALKRKVEVLFQPAQDYEQQPFQLRS